MEALNAELVSRLKSAGANLVGFANTRQTTPDSEDYPFGISIAVALAPDIIRGIKDGPNRQYYEEYERANSLLDNLGRQAAGFLQERGHKSRRLAATNEDIDWETLSTRLPHKTIATRAGLGWIGKCALLVTREFGPAVRLTTVLTDAELPIWKSVDTSSCGDCSACVDACPSHAISGTNWTAGIPRDSIYDAFACMRTAQEFERTREGIHDNICGICIAACPWTQKYLNRYR